MVLVTGTAVTGKLHEFSGMVNVVLTIGSTLSGVILLSFILGSLLSRLLLGAMNQVIVRFNYQFTFRPILLLLPVLAVVAILVPLETFRRMTKISVVDRLRQAE